MSNVKWMNLNTNCVDTTSQNRHHNLNPDKLSTMSWHLPLRTYHRYPDRVHCRRMNFPYCGEFYNFDDFKLCLNRISEFVHRSEWEFIRIRQFWYRLIAKVGHYGGSLNSMYRLDTENKRTC